MSGGRWSEDAIRELFEDTRLQQVAAQFEAACRQAQVPYRRPGSYLLLTSEQWATWDELQALADRCERRYGAMFPSTTAAVANLCRRVW